MCILHRLWNVPAKAECRWVFCGRNRAGHGADRTGAVVKSVGGVIRTVGRRLQRREGENRMRTSQPFVKKRCGSNLKVTQDQSLADEPSLIPVQSWVNSRSALAACR
jgi:hypothetical protein